jgi:hypothetical protein
MPATSSISAGKISNAIARPITKAVEPKAKELTRCPPCVSDDAKDSEVIDSNSCETRRGGGGGFDSFRTNGRATYILNFIAKIQTSSAAS